MEMLPLVNTFLILAVMVIVLLVNRVKSGSRPQDTHAEVLTNFLRCSENTLFASIESDLDGVIVDCSNGVYTLLAYRPVELIGKNVDMLIPEEVRQRHHDGLEHVRKTGKLGDQRGMKNSISAVSGYAIKKCNSLVPILVTLELTTKQTIQAHLYFRRDKVV